MFYCNKFFAIVAQKKENAIKKSMRKKGQNPDDYEGCDYIPGWKGK